MVMAGRSVHLTTLIPGRAATFTRVNDNVSCFSNKRLQN